MATKRNYKLEYERYQGQPEQIAKRSARNKARRAYEKSNGDLPSDVDVDHKKPLDKGGTNHASNLRAVHQTKNTSFARTKTGDFKSQVSKRERKK
jgi:hypothetical protein